MSNYALTKLMGNTTTTTAPSIEVEVHENKRIATLPKWDHEAPDLTPLYKKPGGVMDLFPIQSKALECCKLAGGGVLMLGCGKGKTLISLLLASHMGKRKPLLLIPAKLREKTKVEMREVYAPNFEFIEPMILSYEMLSRPSGRDSVVQYAPDIIICDEAQAIKDITSARTTRLGRYLIDNPQCAFVVMSGTLFNKSVTDFAHLSDWALDEKSPVPRNMRDAQAWDDLLRGEADKYQHASFMPMYDVWGRNHAKEAVYNRLRQSQGILLTQDEDVPCSLTIVKRRLKLPQNLLDAIKEAANGESLMSDILERAGVSNLNEDIVASQHLWNNPDSFALHALGQMAMGMLYYWVWDNGVADEEWLQARAKWRSAVRAIIECDFEDYDTPGLIYDCFDELDEDVQRAFREVYEEWTSQKHKPEPPREQVWVSKYLIEDIQAWLKKQKEPTLLWVNDNVAFAQELSNVTGLPYYGGGVEFDQVNAHNCIVSIKSHGTGKNLQAWSNNLVIGAIASPEIWEQMIARTHRTGQQADNVSVTIYDHSLFGAAFKNALRQAKVISEATGATQRIVYADKVKESP